MANVDEKEGLNLAKCKLSDFFDDLEGRLSLLTGMVDYMAAGLTLEDIRKPMLVIGLPGIGKTCGIMSIVKKFNKTLPKNKQLGFKKILLGQTVVGSLSGIPVAMPDGSVKRIQMPDLPDAKRDGEYGILFLDEITTADEMQIQPALGLADDSRCIGTYSLPEHWLVVAAGNGPDCTNFVRLDDMTLSRFTAYDVVYDYKADWRNYAHATGINENIIAFLNFMPDRCVRVESTDMDSAGKMFPCPRTWERLSIEMKMRELRQKPVATMDMVGFAGRIVGIKAAREFSAFMQFRDKMSYDPEKILAGTEKDPVNLEKETFHILLEACLKRIKILLDRTTDGNGNYPLATYQTVCNFVNWFLKMSELENKLNMMTEIESSVPPLARLMSEEDFGKMCPACDAFFEEYSTFIINNGDSIHEYAY